MTGKTKSELRAEAVKRLKAIWPENDSAEVVRAAIGCEERLGSQSLALIDLLTDDEPANVTDCGTNVIDGETNGIDDELPESDRGHSADMSGNGAEGVRPETELSWPDTRKMLEADVDALCQSFYTTERRYDSIISLLDRQAAITERESHERIESLSNDCEMWRDRSEDMRMERDALRFWRDEWESKAKVLEAELGKLKAGQRLPKGVEWPRFEDGAPVGIGDEVRLDGETRRLTCVSFGELGSIVCTNLDGDVQMLSWEFGQTFERPPLLAKDGKPIEVGQVLYGESDGKAWLVDGFDRTRKWSVWAHDAGDPERHKCLRPEWLTHEQPDSWEKIAADLRAVNGDSYAHSGTADLEPIAERIERLGGAR